MVSDLINYATQHKDTNTDEVMPARTIQPQVAFHRSDNEKVYIIHHILKNSAYNILRYVIQNITEWDEVNLQYSLELDSYSYLHLCVFTMFYDEQVEDHKTTEADEALTGNQKPMNCLKLILNTPQILEHLDINAKDRLGVTALHYLATIDNSIEVFKLMVSKGADVTVKDKENNTVIHYAIKHKNVSLIY